MPGTSHARTAATITTSNKSKTRKRTPLCDHCRGCHRLLVGAHRDRAPTPEISSMCQTPQWTVFLDVYCFRIDVSCRSTFQEILRLLPLEREIEFQFGWIVGLLTATGTHSSQTCWIRQWNATILFLKKPGLFNILGTRQRSTLLYYL